MREPEACHARMEAGECEMGDATECAATCANVPHATRCAGWVRAGHCRHMSAFMLVHCAGLCPKAEVQCTRAAPGDMNAECPQWASNDVARPAHCNAYARSAFWVDEKAVRGFGGRAR